MVSVLRRCSRCQLEKAASDYPPKGARCRECHLLVKREAWHQNRDAELARGRTYKEARREELAAKQRAYYRATLSERKDYERRRAPVRREERATYLREYGIANRAALAEYQRRYLQENLPRFLERNAERRARLREVTVERVSRAAVFERDGGVCGICGNPVDPTNWHLDHIVPLAKGGTHEEANVQVAHPRCNLSKGAR